MVFIEKFVDHLISCPLLWMCRPLGETSSRKVFKFVIFKQRMFVSHNRPSTNSTIALTILMIATA